MPDANPSGQSFTPGPATAPELMDRTQSPMVRSEHKARSGRETAARPGFVWSDGYASVPAGVPAEAAGAAPASGSSDHAMLGPMASMA